jgi:hypothetical protein
MKSIVYALIVLVPFAGQVYASDGFEKVQCGGDIPAALIGQRMSNEPVAAIESRHAALGLKDLGSSDVSDRLSLTTWLICRTEYMVLADQVVRDVLPFPSHSKEAPAFDGLCEVNAKGLPDVIVAVLNYEAGTKPLSASAAWKIDEKRKKFVGMPTGGLLCPRDGIITVDGGL